MHAQKSILYQLNPIMPQDTYSNNDKIYHQKIIHQIDMQRENHSNQDKTKPAWDMWNKNDLVENVGDQ